jgi:hypothetical protein
LHKLFKPSDFGLLSWFSSSRISNFHSSAIKLMGIKHHYPRRLVQYLQKVLVYTQKLVQYSFLIHMNSFLLHRYSILIHVNSFLLHEYWFWILIESFLIQMNTILIHK